MKSKLKFLLLCYLLDLVDAREIVGFVDNLILNNIWLDEFDLLLSKQKVTEGKWTYILKQDKFKLTSEDFSNFEKKIFSKLMELIISKTISHEIAIRSLYKYINLKIEFLNLSSNDLNESWHNLINHYELKRDGFFGILNADDVLHFIETGSTR